MRFYYPFFFPIDLALIQQQALSLDAYEIPSDTRHMSTAVLSYRFLQEWFSRVVMGMIVDMTKKGYEGEGRVQVLHPLPNEAPEAGMEREKQALNLLQ